MKKQTRIRIGNFMKPMGVAHAHAVIMQGEIDPALASRLSQMFCNQRILLESTETESKLAALEEKLTALNQGATNVVKFNRSIRGN